MTEADTPLTIPCCDDEAHAELSREEQDELHPEAEAAARADLYGRWIPAAAAIVGAVGVVVVVGYPLARGHFGWLEMAGSAGAVLAAIGATAGLLRLEEHRRIRRIEAAEQVSLAEYEADPATPHIRASANHRRRIAGQQQVAA